ncbi:hypothetical protein, partial [Chamaesiphon sp. OTE_20_metabat_361]|uniref:hypothetical protein n=1 Tax=Chamaesiphon sp. OTE_20_metabat_361 TaxID=2964689 RepID=UPI00286D5D9E
FDRSNRAIAPVIYVLLLKMCGLLPSIRDNYREIVAMVADLPIVGNNTKDTAIELLNQIKFQNFKLCEF